MMLKLYCINSEEIKKWLIFAKNDRPVNIALHFCCCSFPTFLITLSLEIICQIISFFFQFIFYLIYYIFIKPLVSLFLCSKFYQEEELEAGVESVRNERINERINERENELRSIRIIVEPKNNTDESKNEIYFINNIKGLKINSSNISPELDDKIHKIFREDDKEKICSICLERTNNTVENIVILFCSHYYHYKCLYNLYRHNNFLCPMCKKDFIGG